MAEDTVPNLRLLKGVVTALGVAIVVVIGVIVVTVVNRLGGEDGDAAAPAPPAAALSAFDPGRITIPTGSVVAGITPAGGRLIVRLTLAGGGTRLLFLDQADGRLLGGVDLAPGPP